MLCVTTNILLLAYLFSIYIIWIIVISILIWSQHFREWGLIYIVVDRLWWWWWSLIGFVIFVVVYDDVIVCILIIISVSCFINCVVIQFLKVLEQILLTVMAISTIHVIELKVSAR